MMNLFWVQIAIGLAAIVGILGAMVTLPPAFVGAINEWLRKPRFELKIWCVPIYDGQPEPGHMYCIVKLKVLKRMKGHEWLYLYPKTINFPSVRYFQSRPGIGCEAITNKGFKICQLRKSDEVDFRFLVNQEDAEADPNSYTKMVDYHLSPKIRRRNLNISIDILPE
jgi:hypothetical protein